MNKNRLRTSIIAITTIACFFVWTVGAAAQSLFTLTPVVLRGDPVADGGTFFDCDTCVVNKLGGKRALNDSGQVLILGWGGQCDVGLFVGSNRSGFRVADFCHTTPFGRLTAFLQSDINNQGQVATNAGPTINNTIIDMILQYSDGQLSKIVSEGDLMPSGVPFNMGFSPPSINDRGDVAFAGSGQDQDGNFHNAVFVYARGQLRQLVTDGDPSPVDGVLSLFPAPPSIVSINNNGDVLFWAGQINPEIIVPERTGLFLAATDGIKKIELSGDAMPEGTVAAANSLGRGTLNDKGEVAYSLLLSGKPKTGIFLFSTSGQTRKIIFGGESTPIGGKYDKLLDTDDPGPRINDNGAVAFLIKVKGGDSPEAIFLASTKAVVKVVAIGDTLPTGETIGGITSFSLNNLGQVAFFAHRNRFGDKPIGVYLATPASPTINKIKIKHKQSAPKLIVTGENFITNDSVIEIDGQPVETTYPEDFQLRGGATTRLESRDPRLGRLIPTGGSVQVTVFSSLTSLRSAPAPLTR
jgi:hypothetical protein